MNEKDQSKASFQLWRILSILFFLLILVLFYQNHRLKLKNGNEIQVHNQGTLPDFEMRENYSQTHNSKEKSLALEAISSPLGDEISFSRAKKLTDQFLDWKTTITSIPSDSIEKSIYFYRQDIEHIFDNLESQACDSMDQAIRIYFGKHHDTLKIHGSNIPHPYAGRLTMILRAACRDKDIDYIYDTGGQLTLNPSIDFGEVCPPNCAPNPYNQRPNIRLRRNGVNGATFTSFGHFLENN